MTEVTNASREFAKVYIDLSAQIHASNACLNLYACGLAACEPLDWLYAHVRPKGRTFHDKREWGQLLRVGQNPTGMQRMLIVK